MQSCRVSVCAQAQNHPLETPEAVRRTDNMVTFVYGATSVATHCAGRIGVARVAGVITPATAPKVFIDSAQWGCKQRPLVNVIDYRRAVVAVDPCCLFSAAERTLAPSGGLSTPTALVVSADQLPVFNDYAGRALAAGHLRCVFLDADAAMQWAADQRAVTLQWEAVATRLQPQSPPCTERKCSGACRAAALFPSAESQNA